mgnify:CR=1 FL=1
MVKWGMKLIIGLGNPGEKYADTRHNVGWMVVDALQKIKLPKDILVKKTDIMMNDSGVFVKKLTKLYPLSSNSLYVIHDDLDIPLGTFKIQFGRGPKDHNGIKSVDSELGTNEYWRVRVGIENRNQESGIRESGEKYTLEDFTDEERKTLDEVIVKICKEINLSLQ